MEKLIKIDGRLRRSLILGTLVAGGLASGIVVAQERTVRTAMQVRSAADQSSVQSQAQIDNLANQTAELLGDYRVATQALDRVRVYNSHLQSLVNDQESIKADIQAQIDGADEIEQSIVPLMFRMIDDLAAMIELDLPFNLDERRARITDLRNLMEDANVTDSEKYRRIMEAYSIESDFSRNMEASTANLEIDGEIREVNFFRMGRVVLAYQTLDRSQTGFYNKAKRQWESLPDSYRKHITEGLRVARKQAAPNLLTVPLNAPEASP